MNPTKLHGYEGYDLTVTYDAKRCIQAADCVHRLPQVFGPTARPGVSPDSSRTLAR